MPAPIIEPAAPAASAPAPGRPSAFPAQTGEIKVAAPSTTPVKVEPPAEGSARDKMFTELGKKAKPTNSPRESQPAAAKPGEQPAAPKPGEQAAPKPGEEGAPAAEPKPGEKVPDAKQKPWKLVEEYKAKLAAAERERDEARSAVLPEADKRKYDERIAKAEARAKELEDHIRYVDYSKTEEFQKEYVAPYNKAWERAMGELKEITVTDPGTQQERPVTAQDMLELVNMPLGKAREIADEVFGKFSDDVMAHRKEIKALFEKQQLALEDAKKNGGERQKQTAEEAQRKDAEMAASITSIWNKENESVVKDPNLGALFAPREGDEVWNQRLAKGYELVDRAFAENPRDPKLTPEQRAAVIRRHAAVRNRAASWGALRAENEVFKAKVAELEKAIAEYKGTEPGTGGRPANGGGGAPGGGNAKDAMFSALGKIAKR